MSRHSATPLACAARATVPYNLRFAGQYYMTETGLSQNLNRDYDALVGRYIESDPLGLSGGSLSTYSYAQMAPTMYTDPEGLITLPDVSKLFDWLNPQPLSRAECQALRDQIYKKNQLLENELAKYDPELDGIGGYQMPYGSGLTKPGGHYKEIKSLQRGLKNDLKTYNQRCRCDRNNDGNPPITRNVDELANANVDPPVIPFFGLGGVAPGVGLPGAALEPSFVP